MMLVWVTLAIAILLVIGALPVLFALAWRSALLIAALVFVVVFARAVLGWLGPLAPLTIIALVSVTWLISVSRNASKEHQRVLDFIKQPPTHRCRGYRPIVLQEGQLTR